MKLFTRTKELSDLTAHLLFEALPLSALVLYCFRLRQKKLSTYTIQNKATNQEKQNSVAEQGHIPVCLSKKAQYDAVQFLSQLYENQCVNAIPSGLAPPTTLKKYVNYKMDGLFALQAKGASLELSNQQAYDYFLILYFFVSRKREKYTNAIDRLKSIPAILELWMSNVVHKTMTSQDSFTACTTRESIPRL